MDQIANLELRNSRTGAATRVTTALPYTVPGTLGIGGDQIVPVAYRVSGTATRILPPKMTASPSISGSGQGGTVHTITGFVFVGNGTEEFQWADEAGTILGNAQSYQPSETYDGVLVGRVRKVGGSPSPWAEAAIQIVPVAVIPQGWVINGSVIEQTPAAPSPFTINGSRIEA